ncbi:hypothetical protein [Streptomyces omiyaensis]|uniref:Uncharacterized protein n=1 Tax=Streptomyces omiyaensis TaxID=68247 RepID=A0ABW7BPR7_9ACTN
MTFEELEAKYIAALNRVSQTQDALREAMGPAAPLPLGGVVPELSKKVRDAQNAAMHAFQDYIPVRDQYWATRWGREGNPPKA